VSAAVLLQPDAAGRVSGGYLYNQRMADHGAWRLRNVPSGQLNEVVDSMAGEALVLADSIWLTPSAIEPFVRLRRSGVQVGAVLHSLPSMITAAERGAALVEKPTSFELQALESLGLAIAPGPHYPRLLAGYDIDVRIMPPGVDDPWRKRPRPRGEACQLVSVGAVTPRKGLCDAVDAVKQLESRSWRWTIVGSLDVDRDYAASARERARGLSDVAWMGQLAPEDTRHIVQQADVVLMPSYDENHPLVLLEAMAASVPAVAYGAGAARELLEDKGCGLVASIGDRARFSEHVRCLVEDEPLRFRMAQSCWQRQASLPNWSDAARAASLALADLS
jgi:glycosyltransferase involved in cell wall biosynthesis